MFSRVCRVLLTIITHYSGSRKQSTLEREDHRALQGRLTRGVAVCPPFSELLFVWASVTCTNGKSTARTAPRKTLRARNDSLICTRPPKSASGMRLEAKGFNSRRG